MHRKMVSTALCFAVFMASTVMSACTSQATVETVTIEAKSADESTTLMKSECTFFAINEQGERIEGIISETDGQCYLFVPSTWDISKLLLHFVGKITSVSGGTLDEDELTISNGFKTTGDQIKVILEGGTELIVTVMQSELPAVQLYLKDTSLETVHQDKDKKYKENTFILAEPSGAYNLAIEDSVELKGRGNSTWTFWDKKGYQIKFEDKTSVLGMGAAKKWVLLPNAADDSIMRSQLVFRMAEKLDMAFVPSFEYVDLWIDGDYRGIYQLGEKAEIGKSRLALEQPDGAMFEHDVGFYNEEEYWFYSEPMKKQFTLKEIVEEEPVVMEMALDSFHTKVDELMSWLYTTPSETITLEQLAERIDVDSFAKYYLVNEYVLNRESFESSFYWYQDGEDDVLHLGPLWDFDTCMGNDGTMVTDRYGYNHTLFAHLLTVPEFQSRTEELYRQYKSAFESMVSDADVLKEKIEDSVKMNYLRWNQLGQPNPKAPMIAHHSTFDEAVDMLQEWLEGRSNNFMIGNHSAVSAETNMDCSEMKVYFDAPKGYEKVHFALWNLQNKKRLRFETEGVLVNNRWQGNFDLRMFQASGIYQIDVYIGDEERVFATGRIFVKKAADPVYQLGAEYDNEENKLVLTLADKVPCDEVVFTVWSEVNGQDDIQQFKAKRGSQNVWERTVNMEKFQDEGIYYVHAYGKVDRVTEMLDGMVVDVRTTDSAEK